MNLRTLVFAVSLVCAVLRSSAVTETVGEIEWSFSVVDGKATIGAPGGGTAIDPSTSGDIVIPSNLGGAPVVSVGTRAFYGCSGLTSVTIPNGVTNIEDHAFNGCSALGSLSIPDTVTHIGRGAVSYCGALTAIEIPEGVTEIAYGTFRACYDLETVEIPETVTSIGDYAFHDCQSLEVLTVPHAVTSIGSNVFEYTGLETLFLPVRFKDNTSGMSVPYRCTVVFYSTDPLTIADRSIPSGWVGSEYSSVVFTATGGADSVSWSATGLPPGLSMTVDGVLYGSPERTGSFTFSVFAVDAMGGTAEKSFLLTVGGIDPLAIATDATLPDGAVNREYRAALEATGGSSPYAWSVSAADAAAPVFGIESSFSETGDAQSWQADDSCWTLELPFSFPFFGETYDFAKVNSNGTISFGNGDFTRYGYDEYDFLGTPLIAVLWNDLRTDGIGCDVFVASDSSSVTVRWDAEYYDGGAVNASATLHADGRIVLAYGSGNENGGFVGFSAGDSQTAFSVETPSGGWSGAPDVIFGVSDNGFPDWLSLSEGGILSGTPTAEGSNSFRVSVSSADGQTASKTFTLDVRAYQPLAIATDATLPVALTDESYWQALEAIGGTEPYTWEIVDPDDWPDWLGTWDLEEYGDLSGWPYSGDIGTCTFALRVTDAEGSNVVKTFTLEVRENPNHRPVIESWTPETSRFRLDPGATTNLSVVASDPDGDALTYSWIIYDEDGNWLENGDSTSASYTFSRAVGQEGTNIVELCVSDGQLTDRHSWTVVVAEKTPLAIVTDATLPIALTEESYWQALEATGGTEPYTWEIVDPDDWPAWLNRDYIDYWDDWGYECPYLSSDRWPSEDDIGTHTFALRVTDAEGSNVVKTFTLEVQENPNPPPVIDSSSPDHGTIRLEPGTTQTFSVEAHDPKGDPISFYWYVYDPDDNRLYRSESGGETNEFSWTFDAAVTGTYEVSVEVADGSHSSYCYWDVIASIPKTIYVDQSLTAADPDGTSWETAYPSLGDAQGDIEEGDTVLVAPGAYSCPYLPEDIELRSRDGAAATSITGILSGGGLTVVGFTFEGIRYSYPAPMPYPIVSPGSKLVGCVIRGCSSDGGLLNDCELEDCIVSDCESARDLIDGCDLANCAVVGNTSGYDILSGCRLWNCTVAGNTLLSWYDALDQSCSAWNSILWGNYNVEELEYEWPWPSSVSYGFWWDDATGDYTDLHMTELHDCCVEGIWDIALTLQNEYGLDYDPDALGLIEEPPVFVDLAHGDMRLRTGSPCLDAGASAWVRGETDVAGNSRIQGAAVDLGAYEGAVDGFVLSVRVVGAGTVSPTTAVVPAGGSATFTAGESAGRPFRGWTVGGADAGTAATYTWSDVQADGELVATFGSFSFCVDAATGDDANDGLSWATPKATIQAAIDDAADGESVSVKPGVYDPLDTAGKAIRIASTDGAAATAIDGGGTNRCAYLGTGAGRGSTLAGFTLRNGNAAWNCSPKAGMGGGAHGGTLLDCDITGCSAYEKGGGLACSEAHRCAIVGNGIFDGDDWAYGGGAYESDLYSCLVASNAIVLSISPDDPTPAAKAYGGGAAWGSLYQCTVADNSIQSDDLATGGGWYADWGELNGSIFYGNTANGAASDVENWEGSVSFEQSLVGVDPLFVDRANGDYRLRQDSPAVDAGFSSTYDWRGPPSESITDLDLDGNPRVRGLCIDLGCYESGYTAADKATSTTPEPVPYVWLNENATNAVKDAWGGYEDAANAAAKNGRPVWECYVADLDPEDEDDDLVADIEMVDGRPVVTILKGEKASREYETQGAPAPGGPWGKPDDGSRFFRVKVSLP